MNYQVQIQVSVNVDDCKDEDEAAERVRRCVSCAKLHSVKNMAVFNVSKVANVIERGGSRPGLIVGEEEKADV